MPKPQVAPYGSWKSPITSDVYASSFVGLGQVYVEGEDIYWLEMLPNEGGRYVLVRRSPDAANTIITPAGFNVRTRVHEYGGGAFLVADRVVYFSNFTDQRLYRQRPGEDPQPITPEGSGSTKSAFRYADGVIDPARKWLFSVREDHTESDQDAQNTLVRIDLPEGGVGEFIAGTVIASGYDFYSNPRLSKDGSKLAWMSWNHPNMPWDGTELWVADVTPDGSLANQKQVAGGKDESIFQPEWSPGGVLHFVSDRSGWWNLYRWHDADLGIGEQVEPLCEMSAEFGEPQWLFRMSTYDFESENRLLCAIVENGQERLVHLDTTSHTLERIETPYAGFAYIRVTGDRRSPEANYAVFLANAPALTTSIVRMELKTGKIEVLRASREVTIDRAYFSIPQHIAFPTTGGLTAYGYYYPPTNPDFTAPEGDLPPLLVMSHGGPTSAVGTGLSYAIQYWTSRGVAVFDVNYGGSTGYGREFRRRLNGQWGVVDMDDCSNGALYLAEKGLADRNRLAITGGSAGGYTTLCALTFKDIFGAGASYFGIGDLVEFAGDTHKFELRYLDSLIGPFPERRDLYEARSPLYHLDQLNRPMIILQGLEDKIVPPNQAQLMFEAVRGKELPVAYLAFEGEQHGFRKSENIKRSIEAELYFYSRIFDFPLADPIEPVHIENLNE